ncbi:tRNA(His) guanylyltransferase 2-like isoform X1 [Tripterygium wilfordii]|uniref:tRNA(His) guanylyltransferase 2-like isoform X1 n=1 Tax=Tripterygium wilfordii TaxID=458696 RepID=UPI0018F85B0D|nr:tRNA(His) guanylyltransferase 2-like isoform X1 [Tripterygium wilfordii]
MANSKYEYVKSYELVDEVRPPDIIVVRIDGCDFHRFSEVHEFDRPNDERALNLMNACATSVLDEYPDVVFAYGFSDEYSFVFKKTTKFYQRRASKVLSLVVSFFASVYATKWKEFFPKVELRNPPSFHARTICFATIEFLQAYLAWRQSECHINNQHNTCLWMLVRCGKSEKEAQEFLKGTQKQEKNELLFQQFGINYKNLPKIFRQGSCIFKTEVEDIVKFKEDGTPVKRLRRKARVVHSENIAGKSFWNEQPGLLKELGAFVGNIDKIEPDYFRPFLFENGLMPSTWIVIRLDGCHFHRFCKIHEFEKPNDEKALNLMNSCAAALMEEFHDIIFSYGVSDEFSFVLKKDSQFYQRQASKILSVVVSFFSSVYVMKWKDFLPHRELKYPPCFDGRAVCYPSSEILRDYLAWRQVDCHINNQYNTCFWMLVKSGKSKREAQDYLKGTQAREKNELLAQQFGIDYNALPIIFRQGSSVFRVQEEKANGYGNGASVEKLNTRVVVEHCNIIEKHFWKEHPGILDESLACACKCIKSFRNWKP